jgi:hypothetical protein
MATYRLLTRKIISVTASRSLAVTDGENYLDCTGTAAIALTISPAAITAFVLSRNILIARNGTGSVAVQAATGVLLNGVNGGVLNITAQYKTIAIFQKAVDDWILSGSAI